MHPNDGRVISNFIVQAIRNDPITIYGDGSQTRSFCFVDDMIDALIRLMDSPNNFTGPINIGNPQEFKIIDIANLIIKTLNSKSEIIFLKLPEDDPMKARHQYG